MSTGGLNSYEMPQRDTMKMTLDDRLNEYVIFRPEEISECSEIIAIPSAA